MNILTTDPSLAEFGLAVIDKGDGNALHGECIKTSKEGNGSKTIDRMRRVRLIRQRLNEIIDDYNIEKWVSEIPHGSQSASASWALGGVCCGIDAVADRNDLSITWISQFKVKQEIFDKRSVEKQEMVSEMKNRFNNEVFGQYKYVEQAVADSLGVWETSKQTNE